MVLTTLSASNDPLTASSVRWQESANCTFVGDFFFFAPEYETETARGYRENIARGICGRCAALYSCRRFALETAQPHGIWGGLTEWEREEILERSSEFK